MGQARRARQEAKGAGKVVIGYIHPGQVSAAFCSALVMTLMYDQATSRNVVGLLQDWSSANVSCSRNTIVERFLAHESQAEWLLFIDSDMQWEHTAIEQLLSAADPRERPIVGGLCFGASQDALFPTIYRLAYDDDGRPSTVRLGNYPHDELVPCDATGAAFLLIHRGVLNSMRDRVFNRTFPWFQETELSGRPAGEDVTFCLRARQMGVPIYVDARVKVGHHKSTIYTEAMFDAQHAND